MSIITMSIVLSVLFCKVWYYISHYEGNKALVCNAAQKTTPFKASNYPYARGGARGNSW